MTTSPARSDALRRAWTLAAIGYGVLRVALAQAFLAEYGLNIAVFAIIEVGSSAVLGYASGRLVDSLTRRQHGGRLRLGAATLGGYVAPDVYVLLSSNHFPTETFAVVVTVIAISTTASVISLVKRVQRDVLHRT